MRDYPDGNAKDIYANLELLGWKCIRIRAGLQRKRGVPDALVARRGQQHRNHLLEVKALGGRMRPEQSEFAQTWPGCIHIATSSFEANLLMVHCEEAHE